MFPYQANETDIVRSIFGSVNVSSTAQNGTGVDLANSQTAVLVHVAGSVQFGSVTFTVQESSDDGDSDAYADIDAADLINPNTGAAATFTVADATTEVNEFLAVRRENVERYLRVVATPTSAVATYAGHVVYTKKYT